MSSTTSRISQIQLVMIPSTDQDRSVAFYERLGFQRRNDIPWSDAYRWVEVYPPGGTEGLSLVPPGRDDPTPVNTGIILNTQDMYTRLLNALKYGSECPKPDVSKTWFLIRQANARLAVLGPKRPSMTLPSTRVSSRELRGRVVQAARDR